MATRKRSKSAKHNRTAGKRKTALRKVRGRKSHDKKSRSSNRKRAREIGHDIGPSRKPKRAPAGTEIFGVALSAARDAGDRNPDLSKQLARGTSHLPKHQEGKNNARPERRLKK
jgi:hypothetical protein